MAGSRGLFHALFLPGKNFSLGFSMATVELSPFEMACLEPNEADFLGKSTDLLESGDTINSSYNSNKCPPPPKSRSRTSKIESRWDMNHLAKTAFEVNLSDLGRKFLICSTDIIVLRNPDSSISITPLRCNHKLCPLCHAYHAHLIRTRLDDVVYRAKLMITLTIATHHDHELKSNIGILRRAFRSLCQRKKKDQWIPFEPGYFWRLELTDGQGFHPHLHVLSTHEWIDYYHLRDRWRQCVSNAGGKGDQIWIGSIKKNTSRELAKYLSKDIDLIHSYRWPELCNGLWNVRTYGSGAALRLPPLQSRGKKFICFGKTLDFLSEPDILEGIWKCQPASRIRPDSPYRDRWLTEDNFEEFYGCS